MDGKLKEFIYAQSAFNDCTFCKLYGLNKNCPVNYTDKEIEEGPEEKRIIENQDKCKNYVTDNLEKMIKKN